MSLKTVVYFTFYKHNLDRNLNQPVLWLMPLKYAMFNKKLYTFPYFQAIVTIVLLFTEVSNLESQDFIEKEIKLRIKV